MSKTSLPSYMNPFYGYIKKCYRAPLRQWGGLCARVLLDD